MPNAVAPERGNTRPAVPVDGRLHLRAAPAAVDGLDEVITTWRARDPRGLRDLERATLIRIGIGIVLADVAAHGENGMVGEAVRAALDPAQRHLAVAMPDPRQMAPGGPSGRTRGRGPGLGLKGAVRGLLGRGAREALRRRAPTTGAEATSARMRLALHDELLGPRPVDGDALTVESIATISLR